MANYISKSKYESKPLLLNINVLMSYQNFSISYRPNKENPKDLNQIQYSPSWEKGHQTQIKEFAIKPGFLVEKVAFTLDYFDENGKTPSDRIKYVKEKMINGVNELYKETKEIEEEGRTKVTDKKLLEKNDISVQVDSYRLEIVKDLSGLKAIKQGNKYVVYITPNDFAKGINTTTARNVKINVNGVPQRATKEINFIKNVMPTMKIELLLK